MYLANIFHFYLDVPWIPSGVLWVCPFVRYLRIMHSGPKTWFTIRTRIGYKTQFLFWLEQLSIQNMNDLIFLSLVAVITEKRESAMFPTPLPRNASCHSTQNEFPDPTDPGSFGFIFANVSLKTIKRLKIIGSLFPGNSRNKIIFWRSTAYTLLSGLLFSLPSSLYLWVA